MIKLRELIKQLTNYPDDYLCYAYEGESSGIVVINTDYKEVDFIEAKEQWWNIMKCSELIKRLEIIMDQYDDDYELYIWDGYTMSHIIDIDVYGSINERLKYPNMILLIDRRV